MSKHVQSVTDNKNLLCCFKTCIQYHARILIVRNNIEICKNWISFIVWVRKQINKFEQISDHI